MVGLGFHFNMTDSNQKRKAPAFMFYADDFLAGTSEMTPEEVGIYIRLLCHQWTKGGIPNDEERAARIAGVPITTPIGSPSLRYVLTKFTQSDDGLLRNKRLEEVRQNQLANRLKQAESGRIGAARRWNNGNPNGNPNGVPIATPMANGWRNDSFPSPIPTPNPVDNNYSLNRGFVEPTRDEVALQAAKIGMAETEVDKFLAYYGSNGWRVGKNRMKSWPHALAGWAARSRERVVTNGQSRLFGTNTPDDSPF